MSTRRPITFLLLVALSCGTPLSAQDARELSAQVDVLFSDVYGAESPGAAVLVVSEGEVVHRRGYGSANLEHGIPITPETVFDIASVSKQFAGMAIAVLVEDSVIGLDDDIRDYIPEVPNFGVTITVRHLVHHMSGIRDWPSTLAVAGWQMDDVISFEQILHMVWTQRELNFVPGEEYSYSNTGYNLLAELVQRVTGQSFREWTEQHIFAPLGMEHTHFQDDHTELVPNRAAAYGFDEGVYSNIGNGLTALGSSSLFTTIDDLGAWLLNFDDHRVGGTAVIERMRTRGVLNSGREISYAYGLNVRGYRGRNTVSHGGSWAGFRTFLLHFPEERFGVVVLANDARMAAGRRAHQIADIYLGDRLTPQPAAASNWALLPKVDVPDEMLEQYVGTYRLGPGWLVTFTRDGDSLLVQATAEPQFHTRAISLSEFYVPAYGAAMRFRRDSTGAVTHLTYRDIIAGRVELRPPTAEELPQYEGSYVSEELQTAYEVVPRDGELVMRHPRHGDIALIPLLEDEFRGEAWFLRSVRFHRNGEGEVTALSVSHRRSRNLRFERTDRPGQ